MAKAVKRPPAHTSSPAAHNVKQCWQDLVEFAALELKKWLSDDTLNSKRHKMALHDELMKVHASGVTDSDHTPKEASAHIMEHLNEVLPG